MGFWNGTKKTVSLMVNVRVNEWIAYGFLKNTLDYFLNLVKSLFQAEQPMLQESFEEATERLKLSPHALKERAKQFQYWMWGFLSLALSLCFYAFYLFQQENLMGAIMSLSLMLYATCKAAYFHFWIYQIKQQRLGCTLKEWLYTTLRKSS